MEIKIQRNDSETIISLSGRLDTLTSPQLNEVLTSKIADNDDTSSLILDLKDMDYI